MSVVETDKIDGIGISNDGQRFILLMTDHIDWSHEYEHLIQLQKNKCLYSFLGKSAI